MTGITQKVSDSGEVYNCLSGFARGAAVEYKIPNEISLDGLEEGDLIILHWGINNQIVESPIQLHRISRWCVRGRIFTKIIVPAGIITNIITISTPHLQMPTVNTIVQIYRFPMDL